MQSKIVAPCGSMEMNMDNTKLIQDVNALMRKARPPSGKTPLEPTLQIADLVMNNWPVIEKALIHMRLHPPKT